MENLIVIENTNLIEKNNDCLFSPYATKYYMFVVDDFAVLDIHTDFPFEKEIKYFKENKHKTGFMFDDFFVKRHSVIGFASYNFNTRKTKTKYLIYMGLFVNQDGKEILVFAGNNGVPFESEAEVFTFKQKNEDELDKSTKLCRHKRNGEIIEKWFLKEDNTVNELPF